MQKEILDCLETSPVIAAVNEKKFIQALDSPVEIIFLLGGSVLTVGERIKQAHKENKYIFVHIDLTDGIGKDKCGVQFLANLGVDGIISTKSAIIRAAKDCGIIAIQRFFAYDSQGVNSIEDILSSSVCDIIEIMPGTIGKIIERFSHLNIPLIAGGLIETKQEVTAALNLGAYAVSTGKEELWYS